MFINKLIRATLMCCCAIPAASYAGSFDKGSLTATASIGNATFFREDYLVLGIGAGYFVADGLQVGLDLDYWSGVIS